MSVNARTLLSAYLRYQRDIGVDAIVFERGSAVKTLLGNAEQAAGYGAYPQNINKAGGSSRYTSASSTPSTTSTASTSKGAAGGYGSRPVTIGNNTASGGDTSDSPLSKLSKLRPIDTLDMRKFERPIPPPPPAPANSAKREKLAALYRETLNCEACALYRNRTKVIFGGGCADGRFFVIGGAPDARDEASGLPFQGDVGKLFDKILGKMGLDFKKDIFATYAQKCRQRENIKEPPQVVENQGQNSPPPDVADNATAAETYKQGTLDLTAVSVETPPAAPDDDEGGGFEPQYAGVCRAILDRQIEIIEPKVILIFGRQPANFILENDGGIEQLRAMNHIYKGVPVVATYSLSVMLKETQYRPGAWEDFTKAMNIAGYK